jgi:anti-sigma factor RsiW
MRCDHEHDDGAYVLGALSPAERTAFERHLSTCSFCREAVADIAVLPGLLGRLGPADFARLLEPDAPKVPTQRNRMPDLVTAAQVTKRRERRRGRRRTAGTALAAAALALVVGVGGVVVWNDNAVATDPNSQAVALPMVAMRPVAGPVPVSAQVNLANATWGTKITMKCAYERTGTSNKEYTFRLMAYGPDETSEQVSSWVAGPGAEVELSGATRFSGSELSRLVLMRSDNTPILGYDVP